MSLLDGHDIKNFHNLILIVYPVKCSPGSSDMQPVKDITSPETEFFFIAMFPRERILLKGFEFFFNDPSAFLIEVIDLVNLFLLNQKVECQSLISESETNVPSSSIRFMSDASRSFFRVSIKSSRSSV